jgi:hypothetical protein
MSNNRSDDGSQAWFDAQLRMRAQHRHNNNRSQNPLDRRVTVQDPAAKQAEINDPYIRELIAKRAQQPHYSPIPLDKEVKTSVDFEAIARQQQALQQTSGINPLGDADLDMIFNKGRQAVTHPLPGQHNQQQYQQPQQVVLREGYPVYRAIQQTFGNTFILAREVGVVNQQLANQPFLLKGLIQAYVIPQHQQQVNIQEIQRNPHLLSPLVEVHAPPMASLGPLLVPREAVVAPGQYSGGRQMITDARQHHASQQPQHYYPNHNGRGILKG